MSELAQQLIEENLRTKAPTLELGFCGLDGTESELYALLKDANHLKTLILSQAWFSYDYHTTLFTLKKSANNGYWNAFKQLPDFLPSSIEQLITTGYPIPLMSEFHDVTPLEALSNLRYLDLSKNYRIRNGNGLQKLRHLKYLNIEHTNIEDFSELKTLKYLDFLSIGSNSEPQIPGTDLQPLTNLKYLSLLGTVTQPQILLKSLTQLRRLDWHKADLSDFSFIKNVPQLTHLSIVSSDIAKTNLDWVAQLPHLQYLSFADNELTSIAPFTQLKDLKGVDLSHNPIQDFSLMENFKNLEYLRLSACKMSDVNGLSGLTQLQYLDLSDNPIEDISPLQNLSQLTELKLYNNRLEDIGPLRSLTRLQSLSLARNEYLNDISPLKGLTKLEDLDLSNNYIADAQYLGQLTELQNVMINWNQIRDIDFVKHLPKLTHLNLRNNQIEDISPVRHLKNLRALTLENNPVQDLQVIKNLPQLKSLDLTGITIQNFDILKPLTHLCNIDFAISKQVAPPTWLATYKITSGPNKLMHCRGLPDLPELTKIWQFFTSSDEANQKLGVHLAQSQQWAPEEIKMYQDLASQAK